MNIVFMGTPQAAADSLQRLIDEGRYIRAAYTQPDRPSGRGKRVSFSPVKDVALQYGIKVLQPTKLKTPDALAEFKSFEADVAVVVAYGRILPVNFLTAFPCGAINVHFSLLPKYRGAAPVNWAIVNGETETGVTTMKMDAGLDTGDILLQRSTPINPEENSIGLMARLARMGTDLLIETLDNFEAIKPREQSESDASFAPVLRKEDGLIDWRSSAIDIARRVRGFQPFPTSYTFHHGTRLTIWDASAQDVGGSLSAGSILEAHGDRLTISCGNASVLAVKEIQPEGKRRMSVRDFLNGAKIKIGEVLTSTHLESGAAIQ
jgi:methionyl-tRNA formyltransferase